MPVVNHYKGITMREFKIGDRVRVRSDARLGNRSVVELYGVDSAIGCIGIVAAVGKSIAHIKGLPPSCVCGSHFSWCYDLNQLEFVAHNEESAPTPRATNGVYNVTSSKWRPDESNQEGDTITSDQSNISQALHEWRDAWQSWLDSVPTEADDSTDNGVADMLEAMLLHRGFTAYTPTSHPHQRGVVCGEYNWVHKGLNLWVALHGDEVSAYELPSLLPIKSLAGIELSIAIEALQDYMLDMLEERLDALACDKRLLQYYSHSPYTPEDDRNTTNGSNCCAGGCDESDPECWCCDGTCDDCSVSSRDTCDVSGINDEADAYTPYMGRAADTVTIDDYSINACDAVLVNGAAHGADADDEYDDDTRPALSDADAELLNTIIGDAMDRAQRKRDIALAKGRMHRAARFSSKLDELGELMLRVGAY